MSRGRRQRGAPLRRLRFDLLVAVCCRRKSRLQGIGQVRGTLLLLRGLESSVDLISLNLFEQFEAVESIKIIAVHLTIYRDLIYSALQVW